MIAKPSVQLGEERGEAGGLPCPKSEHEICALILQHLCPKNNPAGDGLNICEKNCAPFLTKPPLPSKYPSCAPVKLAYFTFCISKSNPSKVTFGIMLTLKLRIRCS